MNGLISRWASEHVRHTTDGVLRLDVCQVARQGALSTSPGSATSTTVTWPGTPPDWIVVHHHGDDPDTLALEYRTRSPSGDREEVCERMPLARTGGAFGGSRPRVRCLACDTRRAIIVSVGGLFRCRNCHHLAYPSTRECAAGRAWSRA